MFKTVFDRSCWEVRSAECYEVPRLLLLDYLEARFAKLDAQGKTTCLIDSRDGHKVSHAELLARSKSLAAFFQKSGLRAGDVVCLRGTNTVETVVAFLALLFMQCTVLAVKPVQTIHDIRSLLERVPIRAAVSLGAYVADFEQLKTEMTHLESVFNLDDATIWTLDAERFVRPPPADPTKVVALMTATSGSTGPPKFVKHSHYSYIASCWDILETHPCAGGLNLSLAPFSHLSGMISLVWQLKSGMPYVLVAEEVRNSPHKLFALGQQFAVEHCMLLPVVLKMVADSDSSLKTQITTLTSVCTGGSLLDEKALQKLFQTFPSLDRLLNVFGLSESTIIGGAVLRRGDPVDEYKWMTASYNTRLRIEDPTTRRVLPPGQIGELVAKSPGTSLGYYDNPTANASTFIGEPGAPPSEWWVRTGDLAVMDDEGRFRVLDRIKQMIKCLDCQVVPSELEELLYESLQRSPAGGVGDDASSATCVSHVIVAGIPHTKYIEAPTAFVVPQDEFVADVEKLREVGRRMLSYIDERCAYYKHIYGGIAFVRSIPKTESGKFSKVDLRDRHLSKTLDYITVVDHPSA